MSQGTSTSICQTTPERLRELYLPIREELDQVEEILRAELRSDHPFVDRLVRHGFRLGGKRLRPALVLLSGKACGATTRDHVVLAAVMELVHTATLIHDDVLDEAKLRRHLETVNARWDNEASVLLGDYLFARSMCLASSLESKFASRAISEATERMCEGELRQAGSRGEFELREEDYIEIITGKTAALCACCCRLGAHHAGAETEVFEAFGRFGQQFGVAFQIIDDVLDLRGSEAVAGKSLGTDLNKQKPTLPVIRLLNQLGEQERTEVIGILSRSDDHRAEALRPWLQRYDAIAYAQSEAIRYVRIAREELDRIPCTPARETLKHLADFAILRDQ
jgi:octaprenyl-diphosphate synthase